MVSKLLLLTHLNAKHINFPKNTQNHRYFNSTEFSGTKSNLFEISNLRSWTCHQWTKISPVRPKSTSLRFEGSCPSTLEHQNRSVHCHFRWCRGPQGRSPQRRFWFGRSAGYLMRNGPFVEIVATRHGCHWKSNWRFLHLCTEQKFQAIRYRSRKFPQFFDAWHSPQLCRLRPLAGRFRSFKGTFLPSLNCSANIKFHSFLCWPSSRAKIPSFAGDLAVWQTMEFESWTITP